MRFDILTLFPEMFSGPFDYSMLKKASDRGLIDIHVHDIRQFTHGPHHVADDYQYGGGPGMVMKPEPVFEAVEYALSFHAGPVPVALLSPQGQVFNHDIAMEFAQEPGLVLICGHYGGVDERVRTSLATCDVSIGDYVVTGGELAAMVVVDAVARLTPGVVGSESSVSEDSFATGLLQHPIYTRPPEYKGMEVPPELLSGNHGEIARWRREQSLLRTLALRPDLLAKAHLSQEDLDFLSRQGYEQDPPNP